MKAKGEVGSAAKAKPSEGAPCQCERCHRPLRIDPGRPDAEIFRRAKVPSGVCPDCLITQFLCNTYPINMQIDEAGPELLLKPGIREAFLACGIMKRADLTIDEINWQRVVDQWNLPVKIAKNDGLNPYRMGDVKRERLPVEHLGLCGDEAELPPGFRLSGGSLVVDGRKVGESGAQDELSQSVRALLNRRKAQ